jgi:hypothetical protein
VNGDRDEAIKQFLTEFQERFTDAYASAIAYADKIPEQCNNELRNALTHLSRACVAPDDESFKGEIHSANRHIERAIRDCYKLAVIEVNSLISKTFKVIEYSKGGVIWSIKNKYNEATKERRSISVLEQRASAASDRFQDVAVSYENLYRVLVDINNQLLSEYNLSERQIARFPYFWKGRRAIVFLGGLALTMIVTFVLGAYTNEYGGGVVKFINHNLMCPALSVIDMAEVDFCQK